MDVVFSHWYFQDQRRRSVPACNHDMLKIILLNMERHDLIRVIQSNYNIPMEDSDVESDDDNTHFQRGASTGIILVEMDISFLAHLHSFSYTCTIFHFIDYIVMLTLYHLYFDVIFISILYTGLFSPRRVIFAFLHLQVVSHGLKFAQTQTKIQILFNN